MSITFFENPMLTETRETLSFFHRAPSADSFSLSLFLSTTSTNTSFDEAHAALSEGFGGPLAIPADVLLLWSALGLDAGEPLKVAAALSSFLDASTVPAASSSSSSSSVSTPRCGGGPGGGPVLGPDQFEAAARMLLCEALIKEARSPAAACCRSQAARGRSCRATCGCAPAS